MDCNILQMEPDNAAALRRALKRHRPDALACGYDAYAAQVLKTLGGLGVSVPNDILLTHAAHDPPQRSADRARLHVAWHERQAICTKLV